MDKIPPKLPEKEKSKLQKTFATYKRAEDAFNDGIDWLVRLVIAVVKGAAVLIFVIIALVVIVALLRSCNLDHPD